MFVEHMIQVLNAPNIPWVSRDPFGGWVFWENEDAYLEAHIEDGRYQDGRPATQCECHFIASLKRHEAVDQEKFANMMLGAIERNTPPNKLS